MIAIQRWWDSHIRRGPVVKFDAGTHSTSSSPKPGQRLIECLYPLAEAHYEMENFASVDDAILGEFNYCEHKVADSQISL